MCLSVCECVSVDVCVNVCTTRMFMQRCRRCSGHSASATTHFGFHMLYIVCATVLTAKNDFGSQ